MSLPERDSLDNVEKLMAERRKIAGWLSALDARRADTSPAVYQRVHDDYSAKLDKVQGKLAAAADSVQTLAADVAGRLTDKEQALSLKREERAEAELRAAVGEYSEREWEKRRTRLDDEITSATSERDALRDELARLRSVLSEVQDAPAVETAPEPEPVDEPMMATPVAGPVDMGLDEPVVAEEAPVVETAPAAVTPVIPIHEQSIIAPVEPAMPLAPSFDELAFLKTVVGRPTPGAMPAARTSTADAPRPSMPVEQPVEQQAVFETPEPPMEFPDPVPEPRVSQEMTPPRESFFGRPTPRSSEAVKTLKCAECGTLNFPTEWYCERCGGELAAL